MDKIKCHLCNVEITKSNWSKHIKTIKRLNNRSTEQSEEKHCIICNVLIREDDWNNHIKSRFHKKNRKLFRKNLKKKAKPIINRLRRKRHFNELDFETNDYIVLKSEEALEKYFLCFLILLVLLVLPQKIHF